MLGSPAETITAALMVTFALGVLAGEGDVFTPAAAVILMTQIGKLLISAVGFVSYVLLRLKNRGLYYTAISGGLIAVVDGAVSGQGRIHRTPDARMKSF
jgi:uncharacterized membrane protein (DUF4010 family)